MNNIRLNVEKCDAEKIAACIKEIAGDVSANDIVEIVLKTPEPEEKKPDVTMTSREVADVLGRPHATVFKQIAKFLCADKAGKKTNGFYLTSFICSHRNGKSYPMYELNEKACKEYRALVAKYGKNIKSVAEALKRYDQAIRERFHPETINPAGSGFLLEGKPKREYEEYRNIFNQFITGPAMEGREIAELTEKYQQFHDVMKATELRAKESNDIESAVYGVAIESEMQGFIYGFRLYEELLNRQLAVAV